MDYIGKFEADYQREKEIKKHYKEAQTQAEKSAAGEEMKAFDHYLTAEMGREYTYVYELYEYARTRGNRHINVEDLRNRKPAQFVELMRKYGIEVFTFSSRWSGMIDDLAEFLKAGCAFCGIAEINTNYRRALNGYETDNAIIFYIK